MNLFVLLHRVWDLSELNALRQSMKIGENRRQSSARKTSLLSKMGSNNAINLDEGVPKINSTAILKIEKSQQTLISKIFSFAPFKQPSFMDGLFVISTKGNNLLIVKVKLFTFYDFLI
jgi:hypothetical protein